jgi:nucleotide-binding universal stress UspA family protein
MIHLQQILCPIDLSEGSRHAFDRAIGVARCYGAAITVLYVFPAPGAAPVVPFGPEGPGAFSLQGVNREHVLAEIPRFLGLDAPSGVPVHTVTAEASSVHKEILAQAGRLSADLLVLGTHGRSGFERIVLGSVAEKILRTSPIAVMTVPPHAPDAVPPGRDPFRRILYATDFSTGSETALRYAASLAQHGAAQLTLLHVVEPLPIGHDPMVGSAFDVAAYHAAFERGSTERLRTAVPEAIRLACDTDDVVARGKPYVEILRVAAERQSDVIVLGVHGRNALDRLVFGSTAEHVVRRATCPVLTVRTPEPL